MSLDEYNKLVLRCDDAANYPINLGRTRLFGQTLQMYHQRLGLRSKDLFETEPEYPVDFLEAYDGERFQSWNCQETQELRQHLWINRKEPRCRHVFIQAESSQSPLDCSKDVFLLLLSFHQVMPRFLDLVFAFGRQPAPQSGFHYTAFHNEDSLSQVNAEDYAVSKLGRSGRHTKQCYNLWSVEPSSDGPSPWTFRQTAVYHSFDVDSNRAFWINIKANEVMLERITDSVNMPGEPITGKSQSGCSTFAQTLKTHLIIFWWCCENWRDFLASMEHEVSQILVKIKNAPLDEVEKSLTVDFDALLAPAPGPCSSMKRTATIPKSTTVSRHPTFETPISPAKRVLSIQTTTSEAPDTSPIAPGAADTQPLSTQLMIKRPKEPFGVLKEFSIKSLQRLGGIGSTLQKAALIMKLNAQVLKKNAKHYTYLMENAKFPDLLKTGCKADVEAFKVQVEECIGLLEMEQARITTLVGMIEDGKQLFDTILQYRNMEINKIFAVNSQDSAARMEDMTVDMHQSTLRMETMTGHMDSIAEKTQRETASMHIITLVTLVFLPGTFVATLFGSGLYQWDQDDPDMPFPIWKQEYFNLFAEICFPMMFSVILIWLGFYLWSKRKERRRQTELGRDEEAQVTMKEKGRDLKNG